MCRGGGVAGNLAWQGRAMGGVGRGVTAIIFICGILQVYRPYTHCFEFSSKYSIELPSYRLHKNSHRNLS